MTNDQITLQEVPQRFVGITAVERQLFLAIYAHELTILARHYFAEQDFAAARLCNETLHRLVAYIGKLLRNPSLVESSFADMLVAGAIQKGWGDILCRSMHMTR